MNRWYEEDRKDGVVLSSYVEIIRSAEGYPFAGRLSEEKAKTLIDLAREALKDKGYTEYQRDMDPALLAELEATHGMEENLREGKTPAAFFASERFEESVLVGGENHIRIHETGKGLCPEELYAAAEKTEAALGEKIPFAFDERLGFLSRNPEGLGCGLTVGIRLHLPALSEGGSIRALTIGAGKLGITLRPDLGENAEALGDVYEITNQYSLGMTEDEVIARVIQVAKQLRQEEEKRREALLSEDRVALEDRVARAEGILSCARRITTAEAMELLSEVRLGGEAGLSGTVKEGMLETLCVRILPGVLDAENQLTATERSEKRAEILRDAFAK